jgi:hypothetical protein
VDLKTKSYTRKAIDDYNAKKDKILLTFDKGIKKKIEDLTGQKATVFISALVLKELERLESGTDQQETPEAVPVGVINPEAEEKARAWIAEQERKIRGAAEMQEPEAEKPNRSRFNDYISDLKGFKPSEN